MQCSRIRFPRVGLGLGLPYVFFKQCISFSMLDSCLLLEAISNKQKSIRIAKQYYLA